MTLALYGGFPTRKEFLQYAKQYIDDNDLQAVNEVLKSDYLTTGPKVKEFEDFSRCRCLACEKYN